MSQANWSPEAKQELAEIAFYVGVQDARPVTAERIVREANELANLIATHPEMGAMRPEFGRNVRACAFNKHWILLYRMALNGVEVLHFVDATRDIGRMFSND